MPNLNVAVIGSLGYAKQLGKKSIETDVAFYDLKRGHATITMAEPNHYPEKIQSLYCSAAFGEHAIIVAEKLDKYFGESLLMINACGIKEGTIIIRNFITEDQLQIFQRGTVLESYEVMEDDPIKLRDRLLALAERPRAIQSGPATLVVDSAFNVRGIGTVALATVKSGIVKIHDELYLLPGKKIVEVRSIQKHDEDFDKAEVGDHIGLALKGVAETDLDRGAVLTGESLNLTTTIRSEAEIIPYFKTQFHVGSTLHLGYWLQFNVARINAIEYNRNNKPTMTLSLERPLVHPPGGKAVLNYIDGGNLRVVGTIPLP